MTCTLYSELKIHNLTQTFLQAALEVTKKFISLKKLNRILLQTRKSETMLRYQSLNKQQQQQKKKDFEKYFAFNSEDPKSYKSI